MFKANIGKILFVDSETGREDCRAGFPFVMLLPRNRRVSAKL